MVASVDETMMSVVRIDGEKAVINRIQSPKTREDGHYREFKREIVATSAFDSNHFGDLHPFFISFL